MCAGGMADAVLVVGFEKMNPGSLQSYFNDRANPTGTTGMMMQQTRGVTNAPSAAQFFGNAGREYKEKFGAKNEDFAEIARVNHEHSKRNPYSHSLKYFNSLAHGEGFHPTLEFVRWYHFNWDLISGNKV